MTRTAQTAAAIATTVALLVLAMPPHGLAALHWVGWVPVLALTIRAGRRAVAASLLAPFALYMVLGSWLTAAIADYTAFSSPVAFAMTALVMGATALPTALALAATSTLRDRLGTAWPIAFAALMVVAEWTGDTLALFPTSLAISQLHVQSVVQLVSVTGVSGITFLIALVNGVVVETFASYADSRRFTWIPVFATLAALVGLGQFNAMRTASVEAELASGRVLRVAQIQSDLEMSEKLADPEAGEDFWYETTAQLAGQDIDLVVWPEGATYKSLGRPGRPLVAARRAEQLARSVDADLVVGSSSILRDMTKDVKAPGGLRNFNSAALVRNGRLTEMHDKARPMPFAEYLPLATYLPAPIRSFGQRYTGTFSSVDAMEPLDGELQYGVALCYELFSASHMNQLADSDLLIGMTNDSWYGDTRAPHLAAATSAMRSIELGRTLVRSGHSGLSFVVEPHGRIHSVVEPFQREARIIDVRVAQVPTVYASWGDWFVAFCGLGLFSMVLVPAFGYGRAHVRRDPRSTNAAIFA